jgi:hypothetical protein
MKISANRESGTVLVTTLVITGLVTVAVAAVLMIVQQQNYFSARSQTWSSEIPIAEAGVEEAMAHVNTRPKKYWTEGWVLTGTNVSKRRTVGDGYFYTVISTAKPPVIVSVGFGRIPLQTNYTQRTVMALTKPTAPYYGIRVRGTVTMSGSGSDWPWVDAYDSEDTDYSKFPSVTGGYDALLRKDTAGVATLSTSPGAINTGSGEIWGFAATGPGGTVIGTVGDGTWNLTQTGLQTNHVRDDYNGTITNAALPANFSSPPTAFPATPLATKDYKLTGNLNSSFTVNGKARLWVTGDVDIGGGDVITIGPGGSLEIYVSGSSATFGGSGIVNNSGVAASCKLIGLPTCTTMKYAGGADLIGLIYAPNANITIRGNAQIYGGITGNSLTCSGSSGIHYDEALGRSTGPAFTIYRWEEL